MRGSSSQACAACKYQRRKCAPNCPLAPYFPADKAEVFNNVHRLYGVGNVLKILKKCDTESQKKDAMHSIIIESNLRKQHPVLGCSAVISELERRVRLKYQELCFSKFLLQQYQNNDPFFIGSGPGLGCHPNGFAPYQYSNMDMSLLSGYHNTGYSNGDIKPLVLAQWQQRRPQQQKEPIMNNSESLNVNNNNKDSLIGTSSQGLQRTQQAIDDYGYGYGYGYDYDYNNNNTFGGDQTSLYVEPKQQPRGSSCQDLAKSIPEDLAKFALRFEAQSETPQRRPNFSPNRKFETSSEIWSNPVQNMTRTEPHPKSHNPKTI